MDQEQLQPKVKMPTSGASYSRQENGLCSELHNLSLQNSLSPSSITNRSYNTNAHQPQPVFQPTSQQNPNTRLAASNVNTTSEPSSGNVQAPQIN